MTRFDDTAGAGFARSGFFPVRDVSGAVSIEYTAV
jgi:hypothetical protein